MFVENYKERKLELENKLKNNWNLSAANELIELEELYEFKPVGQPYNKDYYEYIEEDDKATAYAVSIIIFCFILVFSLAIWLLITIIK